MKVLHFINFNGGPIFWSIPLLCSVKYRRHFCKNFMSQLVPDPDSLKMNFYDQKKTSDITQSRNSIIKCDVEFCRELWHRRQTDQSEGPFILHFPMFLHPSIPNVVSISTPHTSALFPLVQWWCVRSLNESHYIYGEIFSLILCMHKIDKHHFQFLDVCLPDCYECGTCHGVSEL